MADISGFGFANDVAMARHLVEKIGIAAVPGSSFFHKAGVRLANDPVLLSKKV